MHDTPNIVTEHTEVRAVGRLAVYMDIHVCGYQTSHPVDISMDIVLSHLLIKMNIQVFDFYLIFFVCRYYSLLSRLFMLLSQKNNQ